MEPEQREVLRKWRVELVENINVQDGLYTQLLSRSILNSRTINRIKNNKPHEQQVEELIDELQKKDCFEKFCEALVADDQEHIVKKFLKQDRKRVEIVDSVTPSAAAPIPASKCVSIPSETDSAEKTQSLTSSIVIRESDNKHVYIRYNDEASPSKRSRGIEPDTSLAIYVPGETRYAMKHFVSDSSDLCGRGVVVRAAENDSIPTLDNPQSILLNNNISDPSRYMAAFNPQSSSVFHSANMRLEHSVLQTTSVSMKDPPSKKNEEDNVSVHNLRNLLRPNSANTHPALLKHISSQNCGGQFVKLTPDMATNKLKVNHRSPHQYSAQMEVLTPSKGIGPVMSTSPPVHDPGFMDQVGLSRSDYVDTMALKDSVGSANSGMPDCGGNVYVDEDSPQCQVSFTSFPAETVDFGSKMKPFTCSYPPYTEKHFPKVPSFEMEDIDLHDGCVNVKVEHCSEEFFHSNYKKSYPMRQIPRGRALIINVNEVFGKQARMGTNFDRDNLCNLLTQLHFNIDVYNDKDGLSAQEMVMKLKAFAKKEEHFQADACFICLLSHGEEEYIFGTDGKRIPLNEIFMLFDNNNCKGLIGKPKVFIIQACRGGSLDKGVLMDEPDGGSLPAGSGCQLPSMSDMLICFPTQSGYFAWRNRARGSWYIEAIVQVFMRYAKNEDVCAMLNRVNHLVSRKVSESCMKEMNQMSQMSEYKSTLRFPHLFFFPGIAIRNSPQKFLPKPVLNRRL